MAQDSFDAASELMRTQRWRSVLNRAYYAAYARVVAALVQAGVQMPSRGNPGHAGLPNLIAHNLNRLSNMHRTGLVHAMRSLYRLRIASDYCPAIACDVNDCRIAFGHMNQVFRELKRAYP